MRTKLSLAGLLVWSIFLTLLLYGASLELPFFFDDLDLLPFAAENSLSTIWQSAGSFPYFRPLPTTIWRQAYLQFDQNPAFWLHATNLLLHVANGWLVGYLGGYLFTKEQSEAHKVWCWEVGWISSTLFLIYPFSFQAVPWIGALSHLLVTTLLLSSLLCFLKFHITGKIRWATLSLLFAFLAPFAHENGVMVFPIILAYAWTESGAKPFVAQFRRVLLWLLPLLIWFPIWFLAPKTKSSWFLTGLRQSCRIWFTLVKGLPTRSPGSGAG